MLLGEFTIGEFNFGQKNGARDYHKRVCNCK